MKSVIITLLWLTFEVLAVPLALTKDSPCNRKTECECRRFDCIETDSPVVLDQENGREFCTFRPTFSLKRKNFRYCRWDEGDRTCHMQTNEKDLVTRPYLPEECHPCPLAKTAAACFEIPTDSKCAWFPESNELTKGYCAPQSKRTASFEQFTSSQQSDFDDRVNKRLEQRAENVINIFQKCHIYDALDLKSIEGKRFLEKDTSGIYSLTIFWSMQFQDSNKAPYGIESTMTDFAKQYVNEASSSFFTTPASQLPTLDFTVKFREPSFWDEQCSVPFKEIKAYFVPKMNALRRDGGVYQTFMDTLYYAISVDTKSQQYLNSKKPKPQLNSPAPRKSRTPLELDGVETSCRDTIQCVLNAIAPEYSDPDKDPQVSDYLQDEELTDFAKGLTICPITSSLQSRQIDANYLKKMLLLIHPDRCRAKDPDRQSVASDLVIDKAFKAIQYFREWLERKKK